MLKELTQAPDFTLKSSQGVDVSLSDFLGKIVILYFYPKDNTPGCTVEACTFRDSFTDFQSAGAVILGISPDTVAKHQGFINKFDLPFLLLADPDKEVIKRYEAEKESVKDGKKKLGVLRSTYIINEEGTIIKVYPKVTPKTHAAEILEFLDKK